jgi:hypothetical protein
MGSSAGSIGAHLVNNAVKFVVVLMLETTHQSDLGGGCYLNYRIVNFTLEQNSFHKTWE